MPINELVTVGYGWINFHALGVLGDSLIASIEFPTTGLGAVWTSVNLSGPARFVRAAFWFEPGRETALATAAT